MAYVATATAVWAATRRWPWMLAAVTLASLALVLVSLWAAVIGLVIDVGLLAVAVSRIAEVRSLTAMAARRVRHAGRPGASR